MSAWPEIVWSAPALRELDDRTRGEIEAAGALCALAAGEVLYRAGDPADDLFVVVDGGVELRAGADAVRRAERGHSFGEEAIARMTAHRRLGAVATSAARVARIPATVLRRGAARGGRSRIADRVVRSSERDAAREILRASAVGDALAGPDLEALVDATSHVHLARGDALYRIGDGAAHVHIVADGLVRRGFGGGTRHFERTAVVDLEDRDDRRSVDVFAVAPSWVLAVRRDAVRSVDTRLSEVPACRDVAPTHDIHREKEARSMLVIDQDACVRCGQCLVGCASAHDDGLARLTRRGEKVAPRDGDPSLLLAQSCHHCEHPACLASCPTGAIVRAASGDVTIREELCTGCGACVKACAWHNLRISPDPAGRKVATKCDACGELEGGPACVRSCPTDAIARVEPAVVFSSRGRSMQPKRSAWPMTVGAACIAATLGHASMSRMASGALVGSALVVAAAYALAKRAPWTRGARRESSTSARSRVRGPLILHMALGIVAVGGVVAHCGVGIASGIAGALRLAFFIATASGIVAALAYRVLPRRLSRLEREGTLVEDRAPRARALRDAEFGALSGKSIGTKALFEKLIVPYARAPLGALAMALAGRTLAEEELRLRSRIRAAVGDRTSSDQTRGLVTLAVDQRAVQAQRWLHGALRAWVPVHVVAVAITLALLTLHVAYVFRER